MLSVVSLAPSGEPTDEDLLREYCRTDDKHLFGSLAARRQNDLVRLAWSVLRDRSAAEDVVQDALAAAFKDAKRFEYRSSVRTWLRRIVLNRAMRISQGKALEQPMDAADLQFHLSQSASSSESSSLAISDAIDNLSERQRNVVMLKGLAGYSVQEVAEILGENPATLRSDLFRARVKIAQDLDLIRQRPPQHTTAPEQDTDDREMVEHEVADDEGGVT